jgi:hypothetical protein
MHRTKTLPLQTFVRQLLQQCLHLLFAPAGLAALAMVLEMSALHYCGVLTLWKPPGLGNTTTALWHSFVFTSFWSVGFWLQAQSPNAGVLLLPPVLFAAKMHLPVALLQLAGYGTASTGYSLVFQWLAGSLFLLSAIFLLRKQQANKQNHLPGLEAKPALKFSLLLLLSIVPPAVVAAATENFRPLYPRYQLLGPTATIGQIAVFETAYLLDLLSMELFFRGLLVMGLPRRLQTYSILPMALFYFAIHLGKPLPEAFSSFYGGVLLGVIALRTGSIWYGWLAHAALALLVEVCTKALP